MCAAGVVDIGCGAGGDLSAVVVEQFKFARRGAADGDAEVVAFAPVEGRNDKFGRCPVVVAVEGQQVGRTRLIDADRVAVAGKIGGGIIEMNDKIIAAGGVPVAVAEAKIPLVHFEGKV